MATDSSVLAWRIPGTGEPGGLLSMGSHRVGHDWRDLAVAGPYWSISRTPSPFILYFSSASYNKRDCLLIGVRVWQQNPILSWGIIKWNFSTCSSITGERKTQQQQQNVCLFFFFLFKRFLHMRNMEAQNWLQVWVNQKLGESKKNFKRPLNVMSLMICRDNYSDCVMNRGTQDFKKID